MIPWITIIATGIYIAAAGKLVTEGAEDGKMQLKPA